MEEKRKVYYKNTTYPFPKNLIFPLRRIYTKIKKLFTMKNFHKTIVTIMIIALLGIIYSIVAAIWGITPDKILFFNGKIAGTFTIIFIISAILGRYICDWDDIEEVFDFDYDNDED